ncbi:hypothetical protein IU448_23505 [Nocardia flavorosea]|uniref:hypothetical protein n=1 Tax=Nocardia flavorosea TaxID=53429 RepID=UPI001893E7CC|nr:hypothetical protein [Nocardia flavorosea]MBF6351959.1 hypothetical protein [Nocardia flavorosea]
MLLIPSSRRGKLTLLIWIAIMTAAISWWVIAIQPEGEAKHADDIEVPGYEQIYRSTVGDGGVEIAFAGPRDDQISQKISAPDLKISSVIRDSGPTRYDWVTSGKFDDGCRVYVQGVPPGSVKWKQYTAHKPPGAYSSSDIISLSFVCGSG